MPIMGMCKSGGWHSILAAMAAFVRARHRRAGARVRAARAGTERRHPRDQGGRQSARGARDGPLLPQIQHRRRLRRGQGRRVPQGAVRHRAVLGCAHRPRGGGRPHHRGRESGGQPGGLRGQPRGRQGNARGRGSAEAALCVHPLSGAGGRPAHPRRLSPAGAFCCGRGAEAHRARQQPRQPGVRGQRGWRNQGQGHQLHRQSRLLRQSAARHHHHDPVGPLRLPEGHQHLRSGSPLARSRAAQAILPEERLCRCARRFRRRGARSRRLGVLHHLRHR